MPREVDQDELIERWTLVGGELERCRGKYGTNGLPFALLWRFFVQHARFPRGGSELPDEVIAFVGLAVLGQVDRPCVGVGGELDPTQVGIDDFAEDELAAITSSGARSRWPRRVTIGEDDPSEGRLPIATESHEVGHARAAPPV